MIMIMMMMIVLLLLLLCNIIRSQIITTPRPQPLNLNFVNGKIADCCQYSSLPSHIFDDDNDISNNEDKITIYNLLKCVNTSVNVHSKEIMSLYNKQKNNNNKKSKKKIAIVSFYTSNIIDYVAYSFAVNQAYAEYNNYIFKIFEPSMMTHLELDQDPRWNKVVVLQDALNPVNGWGRDLDYIVWVDADLIFLDLGMKMELIISAYPDANVLLSAEHYGSLTSVNSGAMIIKNNAWSRNFLQEWYEFADRHFFCDQDQFDKLYIANRVSKNYDKYIAVLPPDALNSDPPAMNRQKPFNQVLHLMGETTAIRQVAFGSGFGEVCKYIQNNNKYESSSNSYELPQQLDVTRDNLLKWTLDLSRKDLKNLLKTHAKDSLNGAIEYKTVKQIQSASQHYVHALAFMDQEKEAGLLQLKVYKVLLKNAQVLKKLPIQDVSNYTNVLISTAEAGLNCLKYDPNYIELFSQIKDMFDDIIAYSHPSQRPIFFNMFLSSRKTYAVRLLNEHKPNMAIDELEYIVKIFKEDVNGDYAESNLIEPLALLANAYATVGRLDEAVKKYKKALIMAEKHVGPRHQSISAHLINYATALIHLSKFDEAIKLAERGLNILHLNGIVNDPLIPAAYRAIEAGKKKIPKIVLKEL